MRNVEENELKILFEKEKDKRDRLEEAEERTQKRINNSALKRNIDYEIDFS